MRVPALAGREGVIPARPSATWASAFLTRNVMLLVTGPFTAQRSSEGGW